MTVIRISDSNTITHMFTTSLENWPLLLRAEMYAILLMIIVSPANCDVDIYTDSQNSINSIQQLLTTSNLSIRDIFKLPNNILILNNILFLIRSKNINIRFKKVKAHKDDPFNNYIDQECKKAHQGQTFLIINKLFFDNIHFISQKWGNIPVEKKLRKFVTYSSNIHNYLSFLHLLQNLNTVITWIGIQPEQLAVLEKTKQQYYEVYEDSDCILCSEQKETFAHLWLCPYQDEEYLRLYNNFKNIIIFGLINLRNDLDANQLAVQFESLKYTKSLHNTEITFLDIIKGFVPLSLKDWILSFTTKKQLDILLIKAYDSVYTDALQLWNNRCEELSRIENISGITNRMKRSIAYHTRYSNQIITDNNSLEDYNHISLFSKYIEYMNLLLKFNVDYIDFYIYRVT
ncbi:hypothetical protein RclHR1_00450007 [Rhizophagus clarus]|nr:hypothetical protein RclHR1_00450007 [Rhizophagus clarus]GES73719.1 ribonuclease H-like domain-containing protein [Rhizophagus clarus]